MSVHSGFAPHFPMFNATTQQFWPLSVTCETRKERMKYRNNLSVFWYETLACQDLLQWSVKMPEQENSTWPPAAKFPVWLEMGHQITNTGEYKINYLLHNIKSHIIITITFITKIP